MSDILQTVLEKFKKVDGGILDPQRSGADGKEDDFIGKHIDNVEVTDGPGVEKEKGHPHAAGEKAKMAPRTKDRKGYNPKEDAEVYESADEGYDIDQYYNIDEDIEEEIDIDMDVLKEDAVYFMNIFEEAVEEFIEEEADDEEKEMLEEMMSTDEGIMELIDSLFEEKECGECGKSLNNCSCDDDDDDKDDEDVIDAKPMLKKSAKEGYGKKKISENNRVGPADVITKRADTKMVKTRTPDGKVIFRKQHSDVDVK